ncbi:PH domain-containing protein [Enemella sp. A6]|uniref:PH domain-containing protein n=1 Tax=Enemella sp. A6 TaxID=3440152 RepID=UPI003EBD00AD
MSAEPAPLTVWPRVSLITAIILSLVLVAAALFGWYRLPSDIQGEFNVWQIATLIVFILVMMAMMLGLGLCRVRADAKGVFVRNGLLSETYRWDEIRGVRYRQGDPWAYLLLDPTVGQKVHGGDKFRRRQMIAIQNPDGQRARDAADRLVQMARYYASDAGGSASD